MSTAPFPDREQTDARDKVLETIKIVADVALPGTLFAMTVPALIAKGRLVTLSTAAAAAVPGVVRVLTADDFSPPPEPTEGIQPPPPTIVNEIAYRGQPMALVTAETLEAVIQGAEAIRATDREDAFVPLIDSTGATREPSAGAGGTGAARARVSRDNGRRAIPLAGIASQSH